eukprot:761024-Prorocentrum_minimum.AAC.1
MKSVPVIIRVVSRIIPKPEASEIKCRPVETTPINLVATRSPIPRTDVTLYPKTPSGPPLGTPSAPPLLVTAWISPRNQYVAHGARSWES